MKRAFTLVELSIVLVIIGLLTAGVVGGQSLVESAKINAQVAQLKSYETAFRAFQLEYDAKPGDMSNASSYWSTASNGNGDGEVDTSTGTRYDLLTVAWSTQTELHSFFTHLQLAGITSDNAGSANSIGIGGIPALKINPAAGFLVSSSYNFGDPISFVPSMASFNGGFKNAIFMTVCNSAYITAIQGVDDSCGIMTPKQTKNIDTKMDDGMPTTGVFLGFAGPWSPYVCLSGSSYALSTATKYCLGAYIFDK